MRRRAHALLWLACASGLACSFTYRAERQLEERIAMGEQSSLWVELGSAPDRIALAPEGDDAMWIEATIEALGGTEAVATEHAQAAEIIGESLGDTLRVFAHWPAESEGLISMDTKSLLIPDGVPLSLVAGSGHIDVGRVRADLDIDLRAGDITISSAEADVAVSTGSGRVEVKARPGMHDVVAQSAFGPLVVDQQGSGAIFVEAFEGDIEISVDEDDNLDIYVLAGSSISVDTQSLSIDEPYGEWTQTLGDGSQALVAISYNGQVSIRER